ncbi:MAG: homoserine dehydrogenase [Propionibacteriaceae bacterium]|jgi:homoserine dehydrogenase|nr:homoserine dehydrogenase [Propionibacteriaceae bacterium]
MRDVKPVKVVLLGAGTVGSQVARVFLEQSAEFESRSGRPLELVGIAVRDLEKERPGIDKALLTNDPMGLVTRGDIDIVVEVIGGLEPARGLILAAVKHGASVVTANKALLAEYGDVIFRAAEASGVDVYYEAAVAGAIPIIRPLRESLVGDEITAVTGIVNGTTNYILEQMTSHGVAYGDVLLEAQKLGYAEADPTADVEGFDAAAKAAILASLAFHSQVRLTDVSREGITSVTDGDIAAAADMDCVVKLLARCELSESGTISIGVHPTMISNKHPLAGINGAQNAIFIESRYAGELMFMGPGAGGAPTASAVLGDVVTAARNRVRGTFAPGGSAYLTRGITPAQEERSRYFVSLLVDDEPGVLAQVAAVFAGRGVSLQAVRQGEDASGLARLNVVTHVARNGDVVQTIADLEQLSRVHAGIKIMRVEGA